MISFQTTFYGLSGLTWFAMSTVSMLLVTKRARPIRQLLSVAASANEISTISTPPPAVKLIGPDLVNYWLSRDHENNYLEPVLGEDALKWVREQNAACIASVGNPEMSVMYSRVLNILESKDKIPHSRKIGNFLYNFWQDAKNRKGLLRRTTMESFEKTEPLWETVLDVDVLSESESENWVYKGFSTYEDQSVEDAEPSHALFYLSRGGADATVVREFNLTSKIFIENGFYLPEAKSSVSWKEEDTVLVGTDIGDGQSLTSSGYPRVVREWKRGSDVKTATLLFEGATTDVSVRGYMAKHRGYRVEVMRRSKTFYAAEFYVSLYPPEAQGGYGFSVTSPTPRVRLQVQDDATVSFFADQLLISLRSDWAVGVGGLVYTAGSLLSIAVTEFLSLQNDLSAAYFKVLFAPTSSCSLDTYTGTQNYLILSILDTVKSKLCFWRYEAHSHGVNGYKGRWVYEGGEEKAQVRGASVSAVDDERSDAYWITTNSFTQPSTLSLGQCEDGVAGIHLARVLKSLPSQFSSAGLVEAQGTAVSADGTPVPYFIVHQAGVALDGSTPTLLYGYGGFEVSLTPNYSAIVGSCWLERGGCYVCANIRGGGEFGPAWHQAALKERRSAAYDDFIAVAEDLIKRGVTSPKRLGIRGGSNGGLLMGNMMTRRPDLFGAVCCAVPLLDMHRYHTLLAGASWMAEYGDPSTTDWSYLQKYSAYHNIDPLGVIAYPPLLMTTSTRDDRVHPYHARSFTRRLQQCGATQAYYYENIEGGHGGAADKKQEAYMNVSNADCHSSHFNMLCLVGRRYTLNFCGRQLEELKYERLSAHKSVS